MFSICIMPFILILMAVLLWIMIMICIKKRRSWKSFKRYLKGTIINLLFLVYPVILKVNILMFACTDVEGVSYLDVYMED